MGARNRVNNGNRLLVQKDVRWHMRVNCEALKHPRDILIQLFGDVDTGCKMLELKSDKSARSAGFAAHANENTKPKEHADEVNSLVRCWKDKIQKALLE